jgi:hypothetical protein
MRRHVADDLVLRDHRVPRVLDGLSADAWVESMRVRNELAPDARGEVIGIPAFNDRGRVEIDRIYGTTNDGTGFENVFVRVIVTDGKVIRQCELFDPADLDRALARFEELCAASSAARAAG